MGCLVGILVFCALGGNVLLISGELNKDNPFEYIMAIIAIIADIALVCYIVSACIKSSERRKEEKEKQRINDVTQKVNELLALYSPQKPIFIQKAQHISIANSLVNKEIVFTVNQFKDVLRDSVSKCNEIDQAINSILACVRCHNFDEKLEYLSANAENLQRLKSESDKLHNEIKHHKIELLNEDEKLLLLVKRSLVALLSSKKCVCEGFNLKDIICQEEPSDLQFFNCKYSHATLHIGEFYYCLFSNVILVFDNMGVFSSAIDPTAFSITVNRVSTDILVVNNTLPTHQYIDEDSVCVEHGTIQQSWTHTCRDGSPDLRYSYNPRIEYKTDKYEYGNVTISILGNEVSLSISSGNALNALEQVCAEYIRKCNDRHNPVPDLLKLLSSVLDNNEKDIIYVSEKYMSNSSQKNYFCSIS